MAEQFLTLMADLDDNSQELMSGWYKELQDAGFTGVQTPGLPFHIIGGKLVGFVEEELEQWALGQEAGAGNGNVEQMEGKDNGAE